MKQHEISAIKQMVLGDSTEKMTTQNTGCNYMVVRSFRIKLVAESNERNVKLGVHSSV